MLRFILLNVIRLNVIRLVVIMLSVVGSKTVSLQLSFSKEIFKIHFVLL